MDLTVRIVGKMVRTYTTEPRTLSEPWFDRQSLALGDAGQRILRGLNVAVVGLGGTGSVAFVQLAHLGVGRITVIDGDRVEDSNVSRIIGATTQDAGTTKKVGLAARYAESLGLGTHVEVMRAHLGTDVAVTNVGCFRNQLLASSP